MGRRNKGQQHTMRNYPYFQCVLCGIFQMIVHSVLAIPQDTKPNGSDKSKRCNKVVHNDILHQTEYHVHSKAAIAFWSSFRFNFRGEKNRIELNFSSTAKTLKALYLLKTLITLFMYPVTQAIDIPLNT